MKKSTIVIILAMAGMLLLVSSTMAQDNYRWTYRFDGKEIKRLWKNPAEVEQQKIEVSGGRGAARSNLVLGRNSSTMLYHYMSASSNYVFSVSVDGMKAAVTSPIGKMAIYYFCIYCDQTLYPNEPYYPWVKYSSDILKVGISAFLFSVDPDKTIAFTLEGEVKSYAGWMFDFYYIPRKEIVALCWYDSAIDAQLPPEEDGVFFAAGYGGYLVKNTVSSIYSMQGGVWFDYNGNEYTIDVLMVILPSGPGQVPGKIYYPQQKDDGTLVHDGQTFVVVFRGIPYVE